MGHSVMIVDDSLTVRMDLAKAFEAAGFRTLPCASLAEARTTLREHAADLIVLDVLLPDGDGIDWLKELRSQETGTPQRVLMLSSEAEVKDRIRGLQTGADDYVGKPYDVGFVIARACELLGDPINDSSIHAPLALIIDDSPTFRGALSAALASGGYRVMVAPNGEEGLRLAASHRPLAVLVDGVLPGIDGATVIRRIRLDAALRATPCILLTASQEKGAELQALDSGADAFVRKSDDVEVILTRLEAVLRNARLAGRADMSSLLGPKKILAVDDSLTYLNQLASILREDGYDVVLAHNGQEAIELLSVQQVDCILLDLVMPGMSGQETCRRIKASSIVRDVPLIMLTALEDRAAMIEGFASGADDYIAKASEIDVLKARIRAQLRRKQFEDENRRIREELLRKELAVAEAQAAQQLSETRAVLLEELTRKNDELEAFSYSVSHDLRAPLRGIDGFSLALLEDYADSLDERGRDYLRRVRAGAQRMGQLIDDLLQLSRIGRAELNREPTNLSAIAHSLCDELKRRDPERCVEIALAEDLTAHADPRLMRIVLDNLLGNAWKFTGKTANARIEFAPYTHRGQRTYMVRDNGAGFDASYADRLFQPFQRLHSESEFSGTGIGLATVYRIIDKHGGRAWAEGSPEKGATFYFTLDRPKDSA